MKKLFALLLALGLLCSFAMAEEAEIVELSWASISDETKALGSLQQIEIPDTVKIVYWVPQNMDAVDVSAIGVDGLAAAFATADEAYTISVYAYSINWQEYLVNAGATEENARMIVTNSIDAISFENEADGIDMVIIPVKDDITVIFAFTPLNGDEDWDATKGVIVSSIQAAE